MANLISPQNVQIVTKDGEMTVTIKLDLNINLNGDLANLTTQTTDTVKQQVNNNKEEEPEWLIPDFASSKKINFGK
jgi:hypothetical protein